VYFTLINKHGALQLATAAEAQEIRGGRAAAEAHEMERPISTICFTNC